MSSFDDPIVPRLLGRARGGDELSELRDRLRDEFTDMQRREQCGSACGEEGACMLALDGKCYSRHAERRREFGLKTDQDDEQVQAELEARVAKEELERERQSYLKMTAYEELAASAAEKDGAVTGRFTGKHTIPGASYGGNQIKREDNDA